jgi:hypothetical protein
MDQPLASSIGELRQPQSGGLPRVLAPAAPGEGRKRLSQLLRQRLMAFFCALAATLSKGLSKKSYFV